MNTGDRPKGRAGEARSRKRNNATFFALRLPPTENLEKAFTVNKIPISKRLENTALNKTIAENAACETVEDIAEANIDVQRRYSPQDGYAKSSANSRYLGLKDIVGVNRKVINYSTN